MPKRWHILWHIRTEVYGVNLREEDYLEGPCVDGKIILKWIFERLDGGYGVDQSDLG